MNLDTHVRESIQQAVMHRSDLPEAVLKLEGMSSAKVRHLLNNITNFEGCRYLEIGSWKGSTLISALFNRPNVQYWAIDNWSEFGGYDSRADFFKNFREVFQREPNIIEADFLKVDLANSGICGVNVFLYDGYHDEESQYQALIRGQDVMAETFIFLVDDWNEPHVRTGTYRALRQATNLRPIYFQELPAAFNGDTEQWWNGLGVFVVKKFSPSA